MVDIREMGNKIKEKGRDLCKGGTAIGVRGRKVPEQLDKISTILKKIFLKPKKAEIPVQVLPDFNPAVTNFEDLLEPAEGVEPSLEKVSAPQDCLVQSPPPRRVGVWDKVARIFSVIILRRRPPVDEEGLTIRQRVKRYNAIMEGGHGSPEKGRKE